MNEIQSSKIIWVLSTGRTGTTFLSHLLSNSPNDKVFEHQVTGSRSINILGNLVCAKMLSLNKAQFISDYLLKFNIEISTVDPLRSMFLFSLLDSGTNISAKKVVHIIRDPRDFVTSFMNWKRQSLKRTFLHNIIPFWQPNPWLNGDFSLLKSIRMNKFEQFCWVWNYKNRLFSTIENKHRDYRCFRFEDILEGRINESRSFIEFCEYLDLDYTSQHTTLNEMKANISKGKFPSWQYWSSEQAHILNGHCGDLMAVYGYGNESEWKALLSKK